MPKIPLYEQGRLASSLVGTPGVDTSGQVIGDVLASGIGQLNLALEYKQRQTMAAQKELETLQRNAIASERVSAYDVQANQTYNDITEKNAFTPDTAMVELPKYLGDLGAAAVQGIEDPQTKMMIAQKILEKKAGYLIKGSDWKTGRTIPIAKNSLEAQIGDLTHHLRGAVSDTGQVDMDAINAWMSDFDDRTFGMTSMLYGPAAAEHNRQAKGEALKDVLFDMAAKGPQGNAGDEEFSKTLADTYDMFKDYMDPEDGKQVLVEARRIATEANRAKREEAAAVQLEADRTVYQEANTHIQAGTMTPKIANDLARQQGTSQETQNHFTNLSKTLREKGKDQNKAQVNQNEAQAKQAQVQHVKTLRVDVTNVLNRATIDYNKFWTKYNKGAIPTSTEGLTQQYIEHSQTLSALYAARSTFKRISKELNAAGSAYPTENPTLEAAITRMEAESAWVVRGTMLVKRKQQFSQYTQAIPVPRFSNNAAEQARKAYLFKRQRDLFFARTAQKYKGDVPKIEANLFGVNKSGQPMTKVISAYLFHMVEGL